MYIYIYIYTHNMRVYVCIYIYIYVCFPPKGWVRKDTNLGLRTGCTAAVCCLVRS